MAVSETGVLAVWAAPYVPPLALTSDAEAAAEAQLLQLTQAGV